MGKSKKGRPKGIEIVIDVLKGLREKEGLHPKQVGEKLFEGKSWAERNYRRIESLGLVSKKNLRILSEFFKVDPRILTGEIGPDNEAYWENMKNIVEKILKNKPNEAFLAKMYFEIENYRQGSNQIVIDMGGQVLARALMAYRLCREIDDLQWKLLPGKVEEYAEWLGLPLDEILKPANFEGRWLLAYKAPTLDGQGNLIISGQSYIPEALEKLEDIKKHLNNDYSSDNIIQIWRKKPWFLFKIISREWLGGELFEFGLVRCSPEPGGIRWIAPEWTDLHCLEENLRNFAVKNFNFISVQNGSTYPGDVERLCFMIWAWKASNVKDCQTMIVRGEPGRKEEAEVSGRKKTNKKHFPHTFSLLKKSLKALYPYLEREAANSWEVESWLANSLRAEAEPPELQGRSMIRLKWKESCFIDGKFEEKFLYAFVLIEEIELGEFQIAPWREKDRKVLVKYIEKQFKSVFWEKYGKKNDDAPPLPEFETGSKGIGVFKLFNSGPSKDGKG